MSFLLVHGGAHGAWCWERMMPHLDGPSLAIDLPGRGSRPAPLDDIGVQDWVNAVSESVREVAADLKKQVVLVGHSLAGVVLPRVIEREADRLKAVIFVACTVPPEGLAVVDVLSPQVRPLAEENRRNQVASVLQEEVARAMFCSDMDEEQSRFLLERLVPEAWGPMLEPNDLAGLRYGVPITYVKLLQDPVVPPALQDEMIATLGRVEVVELDSGHDAMISQPAALARILNRCGAQ